jgi:chaperonin GroEL
VLTSRSEDLVEAGMIDAAKVTRSALENAAPIAAIIMTTEALITDLPEKEKAGAPAMPEY